MKLSLLDLSNTYLSDKQVQMLTNALKPQKSVHSLNLRGNNIDLQGAHSLQLLVRENQNIVKIKLDHHNMKPELV